LQIFAERQRSEFGAPSTGDSLPPSYEDVRGNGLSQNASSDGGPKMPEKISYFLAEVLTILCTNDIVLTNKHPHS